MISNASLLLETVKELVNVVPIKEKKDGLKLVFAISDWIAKFTIVLGNLSVLDENVKGFMVEYDGLKKEFDKLTHKPSLFVVKEENKNEDNPN